MAKASSILRLEEEEEALDDEPPDIIHTYPLDYALSTWQDHQRDASSWPEGTCYNDNDPALLLMWDSLTARYNWHFDRLRRDKKDADEYESFREHVNQSMNSSRPRQTLGSLVSD